MNQNYPVDELLIIDDGSSDGGCYDLKDFPVKLHINSENRGRGFIRNQAMKLCKYDLVLCCDATNSLDSDFLQIAIRHFYNTPLLSSVSGIIKARTINGTVCRWRSRHLFNEDLTYPPGYITSTSLVTYGTLVRKSIILDAGNFNPLLKHSEDEDMGRRLIDLGFKSLGDPKLITYSEVKNSLPQVLERHWRWHIGKSECFTFKSYFNLIRSSFNPMMVKDFMASDPLSSLISLIYPHYFLLKTLSAKYSLLKVGQKIK